jgi:DNA gyrase subunit A
MVQRTSVKGINRYGRASQGVKVMNLREGDAVSAIALVVESESSTTAAVLDEDLPLDIPMEGDLPPAVSEDTDPTSPEGEADE